MTLRNTVTGLALTLMALMLFMGCVEPGPPPPPPPPPVVETPPPSLPLYFVNVSGLALREGPSTSFSQIATLQFNDEVELLETSGGWGHVHDLRRDITGWATLRYLQPAPADRPRPVPRRKKAPAPKPPASPKAM